MKLINVSYLAILLFTVTLCPAQDVSATYPPEGVYATFEAFRNGKPTLIKSQLLKGAHATDFTIRQWINTEKLLYIDSTGSEQSYNPQNFWGFAEKEVLYLFIGNKFHKVHTLGQISYFLESYPKISGTVAPVVTDARSTSAYRLMDMETGEIHDYTVENFQDLLEPSPSLQEEFKAIASLKERKKKMYIYLERFNKEHPMHLQLTNSKEATNE